MVKKFRKCDLPAVMQIWLDTNIYSHDFISKGYWIKNYDMVKQLLPQAEIFVYEDDNIKQIYGFIGISGNYIEGLFIRTDMQEQGYGKKLMDYAKTNRSDLKLSVYQKNVRAVHFYKREQFIIEAEKFDGNKNEKEFLMAWSNNSNL